jgi:DNA processing protein
MLSDNELLYTLALQRVPNLGDTSAKKLLLALGSAEAVFKEKKSNLLKIDGIGNLKLKDLNFAHFISDAERELNFIKQNELSYYYFTDPLYPNGLKHCLDGPILLFSRGNIDLQNKKLISIVGTRNATPHGIDFCEKLLEDLAPLQPVIISGFAYGIDICAQRKAMKLGLQTIGCLAHGLNQIYPKIHRKYCAQIEEHGGFLTEFWSDDPFERTNFLKRNRVIAGISEATIVIESGEKGGSLVTADIANSYNRDVFAVPGRPEDIMSRGCNDLLKSQQAQILTSAADLIYMMGWELNTSKEPARQVQLFVELSKEESVVIDYIKEQGKSLLDDIALGCGLPAFKAASLLLNLELKGMVRPLPGKLFEVI